MTHTTIRLACLGTSEWLSRVVSKLLENKVLPPENIYLSKKDGPEISRFSASGCTLLDDDMNTIMRGELVLIAAPANEMPAVLAPICGCTTGRHLIAMSDGAEVSEIADRVARGTKIMTVRTTEDAEGTVHGAVEYAQSFLPYMKPPCEDIVRAMIPNITVCG